MKFCKIWNMFLLHFDTAESIQLILNYFFHFATLQGDVSWQSFAEIFSCRFNIFLLKTKL